MIRLYDTLRRRKTDLEPREAGKVGIYVCGPTVYDLSHVGHARVYVVFDAIVRYMRDRGLDVRYVRNITDVDDKIIARAAELGEPPLALSKRMASEFHADMRRLGNLPPDVEPRVSDHIDEIVALIGRLVKSEHAYAVDGDVYFHVEAFQPYGALSARKLDEQQEGRAASRSARRKEDHPYDFATLWKGAKPGETPVLGQQVGTPAVRAGTSSARR